MARVVLEIVQTEKDLTSQWGLAPNFRNSSRAGAFGVAHLDLVLVR